MSSMETQQKVQVVVIKSSSPHKFPSDYEVLLLRTNKKRGNFWQNITGSVEENEQVNVGALRELQEETNFLQIENDNLISLDLLFEFTSKFQKKCQEHCFLYYQQGPMTISIDPHEHDDFNWKPVQGIEPHDYFFESNYECFKKAYEYLANK